MKIGAGSQMGKRLPAARLSRADPSQIFALAHARAANFPFND